MRTTDHPRPRSRATRRIKPALSTPPTPLPESDDTTALQLLGSISMMLTTWYSLWLLVPPPADPEPAADEPELRNDTVRATICHPRKCGHTRARTDGGTR